MMSMVDPVEENQVTLNSSLLYELHIWTEATRLGWNSDPRSVTAKLECASC